MYASDKLNTAWRGAIEAHKAHAREQFPREACGLVYGAGEYLPCDNVHDDPENHFELSTEGMDRVDNAPLAVLHSHTSGRNPDGTMRPPSDCPSAADMQCQMDMAVPWGITMCVEDGASDPFWFGDQVERPPLLRREFRHGVNDCYSLIRDFHKQAAGIVLPDYPRDHFWWEVEGNNLYDQFGEAGFDRVHREAGPVDGDVFLCQVWSRSAMNHGGVYIGDGMILHHVQGFLSMRAPATRWRTKLNFLVRHRDLPEGWVTPRGLFAGD